MLNMLRAIRTGQSPQRAKLDEIIVRLGRLEREVAGLHGDCAGLSVRLDNLDRPCRAHRAQAGTGRSSDIRLMLAGLHGHSGDIRD